MPQQYNIPGGPKKGTPIHEAETKDLEYWMGRISGDLDKDPSKKYADRDRAWLAAARSVIEQRKSGKSSAPKQGSAQAIAKPAPQAMVVEGSFVDPKRATAALKSAAEQYHLVSPATVCGNLPEGCELTLSLVHIDPNDKNLYRVGDKLALDATMLSQILSAAGGDMISSMRLDDGSHPHYCSWEVVIEYRLFDGQLVRRRGNVEIDVREPHGAAYVEIVQKAEKADRDPESQLLELRKFLTRHAETKALNRAIAKMGVRRSYTREQLEKPFMVARLMFTGRSEDPEARAQFRQMIGESFLGGRKQLYGSGEPQAVAPSRQLYAPPPMGMSHELDDDDGDYDTHGEELGDSPSETAAAPAAAPTPAQQQTLPTEDDRGPDPNKY